jgi:heme exporter protein D
MMNWSSWSDFVSMRGYGLYVWGSYGVTAALMLVEPWLVTRHRREALRSATRPAPEASS